MFNVSTRNNYTDKQIMYWEIIVMLYHTKIYLRKRMQLQN